MNDKKTAYEVIEDARQAGKIQTHQVTDVLREAGIITLTLGACSLSQRVLCDLTQEGLDLMREYWGLPRDTPFQANNNFRDGQIASCFIDRSATQDVAIFYLRAIAQRSVVIVRMNGVHTHTEIYTIPAGRHDLYRALADYYNGIANADVDIWYKETFDPDSSQPRRGASNVHAMSGRSQ